MYNLTMDFDDNKFSGQYEVPLEKQKNGDRLLVWPDELYAQILEAAPDGNCVLTACVEYEDKSSGLCLYPEKTWRQVVKKLMSLEKNPQTTRLQHIYFGIRLEVNISKPQFVIPEYQARMTELGATVRLSGRSWKIYITTETE